MKSLTLLLFALLTFALTGCPDPDVPQGEAGKMNADLEKMKMIETNLRKKGINLNAAVSQQSLSKLNSEEKTIAHSELQEFISLGDGVLLRAIDSDVILVGRARWAAKVERARKYRDELSYGRGSYYSTEKRSSQDSTTSTPSSSTILPSTAQALQLMGDSEFAKRLQVLIDLQAINESNYSALQYLGNFRKSVNDEEKVSSLKRLSDLELRILRDQVADYLSTVYRTLFLVSELKSDLRQPDIANGMTPSGFRAVSSDMIFLEAKAKMYKSDFERLLFHIELARAESRRPETTDEDAHAN